MDLIFSNQNINKSLKFINNFKKSKHLFKFCDIDNDCNQVSKLINKYIPDLIYIDDNVIRIENLANINFHNRYNPIIFLGNQDNNQLSLTVFKNFFNVIHQNQLYGKLEFYNIRKKVIEELQLLHFNFNYNGVCYLIECITFASFNKNFYLECNLEKDLFPIIAKKIAVNPINLKWSIVKAIDCMYEYHEAKKTINKLQKYFKENISEEKPTIKMIINTILYKI